MNMSGSAVVPERIQSVPVVLSSVFLSQTWPVLRPQSSLELQLQLFRLLHNSLELHKSTPMYHLTGHIDVVAAVDVEWQLKIHKGFK
ncbi:hypothetical protein TYRP_014527 [Tyrophagus putrescentiae]|nr:hypothetical protein TYRP_014527 [Tyrophagus putrescentiae]